MPKHDPVRHSMLLVTPGFKVNRVPSDSFTADAAGSMKIVAINVVSDPVNFVNVQFLMMIPSLSSSSYKNKAVTGGRDYGTDTPQQGPRKQRFRSLARISRGKIRGTEQIRPFPEKMRVAFFNFTSKTTVPKLLAPSIISQNIPIAKESRCDLRPVS